jgi:hypothetical protein
MRKTTLLWLILAVVCGAGSFRTGQKVHEEREKIAMLEASINKEEESLRVLNAEWSYLNQPARLEKLAKTYLHLAPLKGGQFVKVEDIPLRSTTGAEAAPANPEKKPEEKKVAEKKTIRPHLAATPPAKPKHPHLNTVVAQKEDIDHGDDEEEAGLHKTSSKTISNAPKAAATNTHNFSDLMKNLRSGVE